MTIPTKFLALRNRNGTPSVKQYNGGTITQIGDTFGTAEIGGEGGGTAYDRDISRVIQWKGPNNLVAFVKGEVYTNSTGTGAWTLRHIAAGGSPDTSNRHIGPIPVLIAGVATLVVMSNVNTLQTWQASHSTDGINWVAQTESAVLGTSGNSYIVTVHKHRNKIYWVGGGHTLYEYDPAIDVFTAYSSLGYVVRTGASLVSFDNKLFMVGVSNTGNSGLALAEFTGSGFTLAVDGDGVLQGASTINQSGCFVVDGVLFVFIDLNDTGAATNSGLRCIKITSAFVVTNISDPVVPAAFRGGLGLNRQWIQVRIIRDAEVNEVTPNVYLGIMSTAFAQDGGTPGFSVPFYKWINESTLIESAFTGGDSGDSFPCAKNDGGRSFWSLGQFDVVVTATELLTLGKIRYSFILYSTSGTTSVDVDVLFSLEEEYPDNAATISNASAGTIGDGGTGAPSNQIQGLTADNSTVYTVEWDAGTDGATDNTSPKVIFKVAAA